MTAEVVSLGDTPVRAWWSGRRHGDFSGLDDGAPAFDPAPPGATLFRLTQVHEGSVVFAGGCGTSHRDPKGSAGPAPVGDALVSSLDQAVLAVLTADCGALALGSPQGVHGAVHVGWRGLMADVVQNAVRAMHEQGATDVVAALGPCIGPCCYRFSPEDLAPISRRYGAAVTAETVTGEPALDLPAAIGAALADAGVALNGPPPSCTSCGPDQFSHRRDHSPERQVMLVWRDSAA